MENCCRLCSQHEGGMENVFEYAEGLPISVLIMIICPVKIQRNDNLSKLICIECLEVVTSAYQLREISNKNDRKFRIQLSNENIDYDEDTLEYDEKNPMFELKREYIEKIQMTPYEPAPNIAMPPEELLAATMTESSDSDSMMSRPVSRSSRASRKPSTSQTTKKGKFKKPFFCLWCKK